MRDFGTGHSRSAFWFGGVILFTLTILTGLEGCKPKPLLTTTQPVTPVIAYSEIAAAHNGRIAQLQTIYGLGVLEVRWIDIDGHSHKDQGDMELWINLPRKTALRVEKVGEVLLWVGSDDERYWVFDHLGKEKILQTGRHEGGWTGEQGLAFAIKPLAMIDLMGLTPLPQSPATEPTVQFDAKRDAWEVESQGSGGVMRLFFDRKTLLPQHVEFLNERGAVLAFSDLKRYESVRRKGMNPAAYPKMAQIIDITEVKPGMKDPGQVKVAVNEYTDGLIDDQPFDRVFNLSRLMGSFQPDRVEGDITTGK